MRGEGSKTRIGYRFGAGQGGGIGGALNLTASRIQGHDIDRQRGHSQQTQQRDRDQNHGLAALGLAALVITPARKNLFLHKQSQFMLTAVASLLMSVNV